MLRLRPNTHKLDSVFILSLFALFAATALVVVLIGAKQYKQSADTMNYNYEVRTCSSYLTEKFRQSDDQADVVVTQLDGTTVIAISSLIGDTTYTTYIYYYDGWLRELFVSDTAVFTLDAGQPIVELSGLDASFVNSSLLQITFTDSEGTSYPMYLTLQASSGKEAA